MANEINQYELQRLGLGNIQPGQYVGMDVGGNFGPIDFPVINDTNIIEATMYLDGSNQLVHQCIKRFVVPYDCYAIKAGISLQTQQTSGNISLIPLVNGNPLPANGLNLVLNDSYRLDRLMQVDYGDSNYELSENDVLIIDVTTNGFHPLANVGYYWLLLQKKKY